MTFLSESIHLIVVDENKQKKENKMKNPEVGQKVVAAKTTPEYRAGEIFTIFNKVSNFYELRTEESCMRMYVLNTELSENFELYIEEPKITVSMILKKRPLTPEVEANLYKWALTKERWDELPENVVVDYVGIGWSGYTNMNGEPSKYIRFVDCEWDWNPEWFEVVTPHMDEEREAIERKFSQFEEKAQSFAQQTEFLIQKIDMSKFPNKYYFADYIEGICKEAVWLHTPGTASTFTYNEVTVKIDANGKMSLKIEIKQTLTVD